MLDKYRIEGGRGSAKTFTTLKTTELFLENEQLFYEKIVNKKGMQLHPFWVNH